jgi:hypothetical protein
MASAQQQLDQMAAPKEVSKLTVAQLKEALKARSVAFHSRDKKDVLVHLLEGHYWQKWQRQGKEVLLLRRRLRPQSRQSRQRPSLYRCCWQGGWM